MFKQTKSTNIPQSIELNTLFKSVLWVCTFGSLLSFLPHLAKPVLSEICMSAGALLLCVVVLFFLFAKRENIAHHLMILGVCSLYLYMIVIKGKSYIVIMMFFPTAIVYTFAFFNSFKTKALYLTFFILCQVIMVYYMSGDNINGLSLQSISEIINLLVFNFLCFLLCHFFVKNLIRYEHSLKKASLQINEQSALMTKQNEQLKAYIESNTKLSSYAQLAAHELKSPLSSIKGFSQLLSSQLKDNKSGSKEIVDFITTNIDTMSQLIDDLQALGSINQKNIKPQEINLHNLFEEVKTLKQNCISSKKATIIFDDKIKTIKGDLGYLRQLFLNLFSNALKFSNKNKSPIIQIETFTCQQYHIINIKDNGIGIAPKNRDSVFRIFKRLHNKTDYEGSGIGLAICKKIVELHYGTIWIEDCELGGVCFTVRLPV